MYHHVSECYWQTRMKIASSEIREVLGCVVSMQIHRFFSNMEYNHEVTKFPNFGLQANIVKSANICRLESNLGSEVVRVIDEWSIAPSTSWLWSSS